MKAPSKNWSSLAVTMLDYFDGRANKSITRAIDVKLRRWFPISGALIGTVVGLTRDSLSPSASLYSHIIHHVGPVLAGLFLGLVVSFIWKCQMRP